MHAVRPPDHGRVPVLVGAGPNGPQEPAKTAQNQVARVAHLQRLRGVDDVRGSQAEMEPPCRRADMFGHRGGKRNHVVLGDLLDFLDAGHVESAALPDVARRVRRDNPGAGHGFGGGRFDLQPSLVLPLVAPDATHFRARVPSNHRRDCDRLN